MISPGTIAARELKEKDKVVGNVTRILEKCEPQIKIYEAVRKMFSVRKFFLRNTSYESILKLIMD